MQSSQSQPQSQLSIHSTAMINSSGKRKKSFLNKFLTKTYHMLDQCPETVASWSDGGKSFTIKNVDAFEKEVLPKYFNHSKFSSFIRQLNFYGFNKQRSDPDLQTHTKAVRFSHEFFVKGHPELLHKIQRTTATKHVDTSLKENDIEPLLIELKQLRQRVEEMESCIDEQVRSAVKRLEDQHKAEIQSMESSYEKLLGVLVLQARKEIEKAPYVAPVSPTLQPAFNLATLADYIRSNKNLE